MKDRTGVVGAVVKPVCGQDTDRFFLVTGVTEDGLLLLRDGRRRRQANPKKKKPKHVFVLSHVDSGLLKGLSDNEVRTILQSFVETNNNAKLPERRDSSAKG